MMKDRECVRWRTLLDGGEVKQPVEVIEAWKMAGQRNIPRERFIRRGLVTWGRVRDNKETRCVSHGVYRGSTLGRATIIAAGLLRVRYPR